MPLTCNYFAENTVQQTQQAADCVEQVYELSTSGLDYVQTLLLILDSLERLGIGPAIASIPACDAEQALRNATCAVLPITSPGDLDPRKIESLIFYKLNEEGC